MLAETMAREENIRMPEKAEHPEGDRHDQPKLETKSALSDSLPPRKPPVLTTTEYPFPDDRDEIRGEPDLRKLGYATQTITVKNNKGREKVPVTERMLPKIGRLARETWELIAYQLGING